MNPGAYPIDPQSEVGKLRYRVGDRTSTAMSALPDGERSYAVWSDEALAVALVIAGGSIYHAAADLFLELAAFYTQQGSRSVKADDLGLTVSNRGADLRAISDSFRQQAAAAAAGEADDYFQIVAPARRSFDDYCTPLYPGGFP